jgi:hypothetical protein
MKQARAFSVGVVIARRNSSDLDYPLATQRRALVWYFAHSIRRLMSMGR